MEYPDRYLRWLFILGIWLFAEVGGYYGLKRLGLWRRWVGWSTAGIFGLLLMIYIIGYVVMQKPPSRFSLLLAQEIGGIVFLIWIATILGKLLGGVFGLSIGLWKWLRKQKAHRLLAKLFGSNTLRANTSDPSDFSEERRAIIKAVGVALISLPAIGFGYGFWIGRYRFRVHEVEIGLASLPKAWDGITIVQFSDLHSGSFVSSQALIPVWEEINRLQSDILVFTGDWVNIYSWELEPFVEDLRRLEARLGKWAVLGNHDYGDYARWSDPKAKAADRAHLHHLIKEARFYLLEDSTYTLESSGEKLTLVGVGNWSGWRRSQRYGDLRKAWQSVPLGAFSILLSHDPTHWELQVKGQFPIPLTLSGHTHGLQVGIEWGRWKVSPAAWLYRHWAGLYYEEGQYLYVNRGVGYVGVPARIGIWPEITFLRLRRK
ncbi:MAG: metallophosphoesterase [Bacteroidia bacterium]|nr:metallophosphoesterase [Bacteroidia bacterium]MDW8134578.1 metallophosphoesterase [Bacteroidia bacterium]